MNDDPAVPMSYDQSQSVGDELPTPGSERGAESEVGPSSDAQGTPTSESEAEPAQPPSAGQDKPSGEPEPEAMAPLTEAQDTLSSEPDAEPETPPSTDAQDTPSSELDSEAEPTPSTGVQDSPSSEPDSEAEATPSTHAQDTASSEPDSEHAPVPSTEALVAPGGESDAELATLPQSGAQPGAKAGSGEEEAANPASAAQSAAEGVPGAEPAVMPLMEHLIELRKRLTWAVLALLITTGISFIFAKQVMIILIAPMGDAMPQALKPTETLGNYMKVALICGVTLAMPVIVYQIGRFLAPGLKKQEKRWLFVLVPGATLCFVVGAAFAYYVMLPTAIPFLQGFMSDIIEQGWAIGEYLSFVTSLLFWIGLAFELPLFVFFLAKLGIVNAEMLSKNRKYAYLGIAVVAAVITPTVDPLNMFLVMAPLLVLYELGVLLARIA